MLCRYIQPRPLQCSGCGTVSHLWPRGITLFVAVILGFVRLQLIDRTAGWVLASGRAQERGSAWSIPGARGCSCGTAPAVTTHVLCKVFTLWGKREGREFSKLGERRKEVSVCRPAWCQLEREGRGSAPAEPLQPLLQCEHQELFTLPKVPRGFIFRASCKTSVLMGLVFLFYMLNKYKLQTHREG